MALLFLLDFKTFLLQPLLLMVFPREGGTCGFGLEMPWQEVTEECNIPSCLLAHFSKLEVHICELFYSSY